MRKSKNPFENLTEQNALDALEDGQAVLLEMIDISKSFDPSNQKKYQVCTQRLLKICNFLFQGDVGIYYRDAFQRIGKLAFSNIARDQQSIKNVHGAALYRLIWSKILCYRFQAEFIDLWNEIQTQEQAWEREVICAIQMMKLSFEKYDESREDRLQNDCFSDTLDMAKSFLFDDKWNGEWAAMEKAKINSRIGVKQLPQLAVKEYPGAM